MSKIATIIVTYNRKAKLRRCLEAVFAQTIETKPDIIIVDNGSSDGTEDMIREMIADALDNTNRRIIYCNLHHNSGGAGGFCYGMRRAVEEGYDYLWLMDDDSIPSNTALLKLLEFSDAHKGEYGFLSSKVLWKDGSVCRMNIPRETMFRNLKDWSRKVIPVTMASFVSIFVPASIVLDVGLPFREFYIWVDDWEYTRRLSTHYPCYLINDSEVTHDMEINSKADILNAPNSELVKYKFKYRNEFFLYRREGLKGLLYEMLRVSFIMLKLLFSSMSNKEKLKRIKLVATSTAEGIHFRPITEKVLPTELYLEGKLEKGD